MGDDLNSVELASERAIIDVPENCVKIWLVCTVFLDGEKQELQTVERTLSMSEIKEAVRKADREAMERAGY